jgi:hypothetical protein
MLMLIKKRHFAAFKRKQRKFCEKNSQTVAEFVIKCDEFVIASKYDHYSKTIIT